MNKPFFKGKWQVFPVFAFAAVLALALPGFALAQSQGAQAIHAVPLASVTGPSTTNLSPIVVTGHKLYLPVALQMIKAALKRPVSFTYQNLNKLVCQFVSGAGRLPPVVLYCRTNCEIWIENEAYQGVGVSTQLCDSGNSNLIPAIGPGQMTVTLAGWIAQHRVNRGALLALLKKLPPANSSYTLRVKNHGKVVAQYVFKNGNLVSVYKKAKHTK